MDKRIYNKKEWFDDNDKFREPERHSTFEEKETKPSVEPMAVSEPDSNTAPETPARDKENSGAGVSEMAVEEQ